MLLKNLYDSHVHLAATGEMACQADLSVLKSLEDFARLKPRPADFRGPWLVGFGWDENRWPEARAPRALDLDRFFPDTPVYFSRCDGHSGVTNSRGLALLGKSGEGVFYETEHYLNLQSLPAASDEEMRRYLSLGMKRFNAAGFTHVRDMAGGAQAWNESLRLEDRGESALHVDWNFACENLADFDRVLEEAKAARRAQSPLNKLLGMKFYYDGSLGSDTALLSQPYLHRDDGTQGMACWSLDEAAEVIRRSWENDLEVAVHTIGDEAVDRMVEIARQLSAAGLGGRLNLEHAEIIRPETIQKMKPLHVICHLQPCHWLTDRLWLEKKLGPLARHAFPWEALRRMKIPVRFGSDSPIEAPSLFSNLKALRESVATGIPALQGDPLSFHVHPDPHVTAGESLFADEKTLEVRLNGRVVFSARD
ncbi:MAG: amidohydrolase family protein [Bdellovibrionaceae bacterium]|nr:amidohydrolase family protein [Pseudobdellovibrionaceae bacterium]MBX3034400.1 amidohydrolase family protein [Pseudobdellovibrionaceae bacterium]